MVDGIGSGMYFFLNNLKKKIQARTIRLFGDYDGPSLSLSSQQARELGFNKSLMERLDKDLGNEVNFHLQRQYRSIPAIQKWASRVFYGHRAAEPEESVQNISLDDLLVNSSQIVTDPLVLVDLNRLDGEWREHMFGV